MPQTYADTEYLPATTGRKQRPPGASLTPPTMTTTPKPSRNRGEPAAVAWRWLTTPEDDKPRGDFMAAQAVEPDFQTVADAYARRSLESIRDDIAALEHARECTERDTCKIGSETRRVQSKGKKYRVAVHNNSEAWHDEEAARRAIEEGPLSVEVRGDWHTPGSEEESRPTEYNILLGTGGPAARIVGDLNEHGQPGSAHFEYQDWFKPWTRARLSGEEEDVLLAYAGNFYFGD